MMKKGYLYLVLLLLIVFESCSKILEVEDDLVQEGTFITSEEEVDLLTTSAYAQLAYGSCMGGNVWLASELLADNVYGELFTGDFAAYFNRNTGIFISFSRDIWAGLYAAAGEVNRVLASIDNIEMDAGTKNAYIGSLTFVRAVAHFELVRLFAQPYGYTSDNSHLGIPIRDFWNKDDLSQPVDRSTVAQVYDKIIEDFNTAIQNLPTTNPFDPSFANQLSAKAYLARVYFQMNDFQNAYDLANEVINSNQYALNDFTVDRFDDNPNNSEFIFYQSSDGPFNAGEAFKGHYFTGEGLPAVTLSSGFYALLSEDANDIRLATGMVTETDGFYRLNKVGSGNQNLHHPVLHLTEIMLIRAESAVELGMRAQGIADVDAIRNRAGLGGVQEGLSDAELLEEIQKQRRIEMVGEGNRLHDLKRIAVNGNQSLLIRGAPWDCPGMVVQLPDEELGGNPDMEPNPQGGC